MATDYRRLFKGVADAKPISGFAPRIGVGAAREVILLRFGVKASQQGHGDILEADFLDSATGETRGWAWFVSSQGWAGAYEEARAKDFLTCVKESLDLEEEVDDIGAMLASPDQNGRGLSLIVQVDTQRNANGTPKLNKKQQEMTVATWSPIKQTLEEMAAKRTELDKLAPAAAAPAASPAKTGGFGKVTQPAATPSAPPAATPAATQPVAMAGLFGRKTA